MSTMPAALAPHLIADHTDFWVFNKPAGLLSIPDRAGNEPSLKAGLEAAFGKENVYTVHRLDRDTSGVIVFAKNADAHKVLSQLFEGREVEKYYLGLVRGLFHQSSGTVDAPIAEHSAKNGRMVVHQRGKPSRTDYEVLGSAHGYSLTQFRIHTGRTHQIRVHVRQLGLALVADPLYGDGKPFLLSEVKRKFKLGKEVLDEQPLLGRLALHSWRLGFQYRGQDYFIECPPPKDLRATIKQLGLQLPA